MRKWLHVTGRERRHKIIRKRLAGTSDRPRLNVYRSLSNLYAQLIDDAAGKTVLSVSARSPELKGKIKDLDAGNVKGASTLGEALAGLAKKKGITKVVFDRSGYLYHGRVKALAEAARKGGLEF